MRLRRPSFFLSAGCFRAEVYGCGYAPCIGNEAQTERGGGQEREGGSGKGEPEAGCLESEELRQ